VAPEQGALDVDVREIVVRARAVTEGGGRAFEYRLALPADVDPDRVDATMDHGLLRVTLPRGGQGRPPDDHARAPGCPGIHAALAGRSGCRSGDVVLCGTAAIDCNGRVAEATVLGALGWSPAGVPAGRDHAQDRLPSGGRVGRRGPCRG
jgi:hypothetical protein